MEITCNFCACRNAYTQPQRCSMSFEFFPLAKTPKPWREPITFQCVRWTNFRMGRSQTLVRNKIASNIDKPESLIQTFSPLAVGLSQKSAQTYFLSKLEDHEPTPQEFQLTALQPHKVIVRLTLGFGMDSIAAKQIYSDYDRYLHVTFLPRRVEAYLQP